MEIIPIRNFERSKAEPIFTGNFSIRRLEDILDGKDMKQEIHRHDFYFILALERAAGHHQIDFKSYAVDNYSVFTMRPGQVHSLELKHDSSGYLLQFSKDFYNGYSDADTQIFHKTTRMNFFMLGPDVYQKVNIMLDGIHNEFRGKQQVWTEVIRANLNIFFIELFRNMSHNDASTASNTLYQSVLLEEFLALLEQHSAKQKQVSFYAEKLNLTPKQLNAITRKTLGKNSSDLLHEQIILEARRYLLATSHQVKEIAYHLGFEEASYFIRFFRKQTGYTPEIFRKTFR